MRSLQTIPVFSEMPRLGGWPSREHGETEAGRIKKVKTENIRSSGRSTVHTTLDVRKQKGRIENGADSVTGKNLEEASHKP